MDFDEVIRRRRMCRNFRDDPVDPGLVERLLERARRAPSAGFTQGPEFLVLDRPTEVTAFWDVLADDRWRRQPSLPGLMRAPVVIVPCCSAEPYLARYSEPDKAGHDLGTADAWPVPYWTVDASFSTMVLLLGAVAEGLGALFFGRRAEDHARVKSEFGIPPAWDPIGVVLLGWPADDPGPPGSARTRRRRDLTELLHRGSW